jgi:hypothetical protein
VAFRPDNHAIASGSGVLVFKGVVIRDITDPAKVLLLENTPVSALRGHGGALAEHVGVAGSPQAIDHDELQPGSADVHVAVVRQGGVEPVVRLANVNLPPITCTASSAARTGGGRGE